MSGSNPQVPQGTVNRLIASWIFPNFPQLTITPSFLGKRAITVSRQGKATTNLENMTGVTTSPEPYILVIGTVHLIKAQAFAQIWRNQLETTTLLGPSILRPDTRTMAPYFYDNCTIESVGDDSYAGDSAEYELRISGVYQINAALFAS